MTCNQTKYCINIADGKYATIVTMSIITMTTQLLHVHHTNSEYRSLRQQKRLL